MPSETNSYAFCANYSDIAACLFAIQTSEANGLFAADAQLLKLLRLFEKDKLRKLYLRTLRVLKDLDASNYIGGDLINKDFFHKDFFTGYLVTDTYDGNTDYMIGDFEDEDFTYLDFWVGFLDDSNTSYSGMFQTIINIFGEMCRRHTEISEQDKTAIADALVPVLDAFEELQSYLQQAGLSPCVNSNVSRYNNTKGVYLQAAGSDGTDGIAEGLHLRWSLTGELGEYHLPKGNYNNAAGQTTGFNKADDYIRVSRTPYVNRVRVAINFESDKPVINFENRTWTYLVNQTVNGQQISNRIRLKFINTTLYDQRAAVINPETYFFSFLKQYAGEISITVVDKPMFLAGFDLRRSGISQNGVLKVEGLCQLPGVNAEEDTYIRKTIALGTAAALTDELKGDNIVSLKVKKYSGSYLQAFYAETYTDFLSTRAEQDWVPVGDGFALSVADELVYDRLENAQYPVDNLWPQYNNGTTVRVANYQDRWAVSRPNEPSLKEVVNTYLELSETDPRAEDVLRDEDTGDDIPGLLVSYLDMLNLQAMDYHMARMLGMGFIDTTTGGQPTDKFVYRLTYVNRKAMGSNEVMNYSYLSLPVAKTDKLLPQKPQLRALKYGLPVTDGEFNNVFDKDGYTSMDNVRAVNIGRKLFIDEIEGYDFFADASVVNMNVFEHSKPVLYGIEYREENQTTYVKPEITTEKALGTVYNAHDSDFPENGVAETTPVPDDETSLYLHFERQSGVHHYAAYGINWFGRSSLLSDEVKTDLTVFPIKNALLPPTDVTVQYIQKEESLVFTTSTEQEWLKGREENFPDQDVNFTRLTFNWLDIEDISNLRYPTAQELNSVARPDKMKVFFKPEMPMEVTGVIRDLVPVQGSDTQLQIHTGSYATIDGTIVSPAIDPSAFFRFKDSLLSAVEGQYRVVAISAGADWPVITIEKSLTVTAVGDETDPGTYGAHKTYTVPDIGSRFSMVENLSEAANWEAVAEDISLVSFADAVDPVIESSADTEGNITKYWVGGITANAQVIPLFSADENPGELPGYYQVVFEGEDLLAAHPQVNLPFDQAEPGKNSPSALAAAHVEWYKGWIRMEPANGTEKLLMQVVTIDQSSDQLTVYLYDPNYAEGQINVSASAQDLKEVNFHPGYRVYLFPEPAPEHSFNGSHILPADDENNKKSLIGIQSADTRAGGTGYASKVSLPAVLLARRIEEPVQMEAPEALVLKVRPDATGKAAFTFDMEIRPDDRGRSRNPFGFMFYRTTDVDILQALYTPETIAGILDSLNSLIADPSYNERFLELANMVFDPANPAQFRVFEATPQAYGFPVPDKAGLADPEDDQIVRSQLYYNAIIGTLLPLTEQTPVFNFIKEGLQTENKLPVIRDIDGNLLNAADPSFNPFPMIRKYTKAANANSTYIRFTDYLLNGSSRSLYFFAGTEMNNQLMPGVLSPFTGPVTILHTAHSAAPVIRKFSLAASAIASDSTAVTFQVAPMSPEDRISRIRVYRTTDPLKAGVLQQINTFFDVEITVGAPEGYVVTDDFSDMATPVGEPVYYTLVGIRTIVNEAGEDEDVISEPSATITVNLIDTVNPQAPELTYTESTNGLSWQPTANKGTYYLFQQNSKGNWARIYTVQPADSSEVMEYILPQPLVRQDEDGNRIYYRFKVQAQNASGLLNLTEKELTI